MANLTPPLIAAAITILGWYVTYAYTRHREDRTRRLTIALKYRERQIEELYGPLVSLIEQILNVWLVRQRILQSPEAKLPDETKQLIRQYFWLNHFSPLHKDIRELLRAKVYLLEGGVMPQSIIDYFQHSVQESAQRELLDGFGVDTSFIERKRWPREFYKEAKETLSRLMLDYQGDLEGLGIAEGKRSSAPRGA